MFLDTHYRQEDQDSLACKAILLSFQGICGWRERTVVGRSVEVVEHQTGIACKLDSVEIPPPVDASCEAANGQTNHLE